MRGDARWKWWIEDKDFRHTFNLMLARTIDGEGLEGYVRRDGSYRQYEPGTALTDEDVTLTLNRGQMVALAKRMLEWAGEQNMRTEPEENLKGQLTATKYHLEDLRTMLKLKGTNE